MEKNITFSNNIPTAPVLWKSKDGIPMLVQNYKAVLKRVSITREKLRKFPSHIQRQFKDCLEEWIHKGIIEPVPYEEREKGFYIPYQVVVREDKASSKVRIVLDCASNFGGKSLNSEIKIGSNPMGSLQDILLQFRKHKYALTANVKEMFLAAKLREQDKDYHQIMIEKDGEMKPYRFTSFPFRNACSPKVAITVARMAAEKFEGKYPEASSAIVNNTLMDLSLIHI